MRWLVRGDTKCSFGVGMVLPDTIVRNLNTFCAYTTRGNTPTRMVESLSVAREVKEAWDSVTLITPETVRHQDVDRQQEAVQVYLLDHSASSVSSRRLLYSAVHSDKCLFNSPGFHTLE